MPKQLRQVLKATDFFILLAIIVVVYLATRRFPDWRLEISMIAGFVVFAILVWKVLALYLDANIYSERKDFVDLHAKILGSVAIVAGLLFTWQGIKLNQTTSETTQRLSLMTLQNSERSQLEERFNRALEQLGNDKREARIGAIYSLGKIAADSIDLKSRFDAMNSSGQVSANNEPAVKGPVDFHWPVMQTLASYLRGNATKAQKTTRPPEQIAPDIQACLDVLGWRSRSYLNGEDQRLELYGTDIRGAVLKDKESGTKSSIRREGAHLEGAQLYDVDLEKANLRGIHLEGAILANANLKNAYLYGAYLADADLNGADLEGADLGGVSGLTPSQLKLARNWDKARGLSDETKKALQSDQKAP